MREIQVYADVVFDGATTVGYDYDVELVLCTIMGKETALVKKRENSLYFLVDDYSEVYNLLRLYYMSTKEASAMFVEKKLSIADASGIAYLPSKVILAKDIAPEASEKPVEQLKAV